MRTLAWTTLPVAAPPGTTLLAAFPASCAVAVVPHPSTGTVAPVVGSESLGAGASAILASHHSDAKLHSSSRASTTNQRTATPARRGHHPNKRHRLAC